MQGGWSVNVSNDAKADYQKAMDAYKEYGHGVSETCKLYAVSAYGTDIALV